MNVNMSTGATYYAHMRALRDAVEADRTGVQELVVTVPGGATARLLLDRHSLFLVAFQGAGGSWYRFPDHQVPASYKATALAKSSNYNHLGGLEFKISRTSLAGITCLGHFRGSSLGTNEKKAFRQLSVATSEALRFANVITWMMAALNQDRAFDVGRRAAEIRDWATGTRAGALGILVPHI